MLILLNVQLHANLSHVPMLRVCSGLGGGSGGESEGETVSVESSSSSSYSKNVFNVTT